MPRRPISITASTSEEGPVVDLAQALAVAVEAARLARPQKRPFDQPALVDALAVAAEDQAAAGIDLAPPPPVDAVGDPVEPVGGAVRGVDRAVRVAVEPGRQRAGDRRLLDDVRVADLDRQCLDPAALHP